MSSPRLEAEDEGLRALDNGCGLDPDWDLCICGAGAGTAASNDRRGSAPSSDILEPERDRPGLGSCNGVGEGGASRVSNSGLEAAELLPDRCLKVDFRRFIDLRCGDLCGRGDDTMLVDSML